MSDQIEFVRFRPENQANEGAEDAVVVDRNTLTIEEFKRKFAGIPPSASILPVFCNSSNQIIHSVSQVTKQKQDQIIDPIIYYDPNDNLKNASMNMCFVSESSMLHKIKSDTIHFLGKEIVNQGVLGNIALVEALYQLRTKMVEQLPASDKVKGCHILLSPLNATARDLHYAQQRVRNICHNLYENEYKFIIRTLFDYIPEDKNDPDDQSYTNYLEKQYKGDICHTIMELSFIRMYVVGNELRISNKWSQKLVALELDTNQDHASDYVERCSFIINERVANRFTQDLVPIFGGAWQIQRAIAKKLNDVRDDIIFQNALLSIHGCLQNREMTVNAKLHQRSLANSANSASKFSSKIHPIQQAQNSLEEKQVVGDIESQIVS